VNNMAFSNSKDFSLEISDYIEEAYERLGVVPRTGYDLDSAKRSLNLLFADWANRGLNRWTIEQKTLPLATGITNYPVGTLVATVAASTSFSVAELVTGSVSAATANITSKPSATQLALTLPTGTFSSGETLTGSTSGATTTLSAALIFEDIEATIDVLSGVLRQNAGTSTQSDTTLNRISRDQYLNLTSKLSTSQPTQFYVDRQIQPSIRFFSTPNSNDYEFVYDRLVRMDDADTYINGPQVPFRFYPCLTAGLAYYLSMKKNPQLTTILKAVYEEEFERAAAEDRDRASLNLIPAKDFYGFISV
tara:strand:- start:1870 stop:2787 length:918 start_codon:yes stop_codon:yes gene_type:complete